jgi:hypothetical protein
MGIGAIKVYRAPIVAIIGAHSIAFVYIFIDNGYPP